uniref:Secreted protein n=1 Tax=Arundo donax TaxID=35708 RepID=A0A0A9CP87_ARUDO
MSCFLLICLLYVTFCAPRIPDVGLVASNLPLYVTEVLLRNESTNLIYSSMAAAFHGSPAWPRRLQHLTETTLRLSKASQKKHCLLVTKVAPGLPNTVHR